MRNVESKVKSRLEPLMNADKATAESVWKHRWAQMNTDESKNHALEGGRCKMVQRDGKVERPADIFDGREAYTY